jgi:hypothetical protein
MPARRPRAAIAVSSLSTLAILACAVGAAAPACFSDAAGAGPSDDGGTDAEAAPDDATMPDTGSDGAMVDVTEAAPPEASADAADAHVSDASDGGTADASDASDASDAAPACNLAMPFGPRSLVPGLATAGSDEYSARLSADQLTVYFQSNRPSDAGLAGFFQVYTATRPDVSSPFGPATMVTSFISADTEKPTLTADGLTLYAARTFVDDAGALTLPTHVYASTRASTAAAFPPPSEVTSIELTGGFETDPFVTADGATLYFMDFYRLYSATLDADGGFTTPQEITSATSSGDVQGNPLPSADGLTLYFMSNRALTPDGGETPGNDVWVAGRASTTDPFGTPVNVAELNTPSNNEPTWLSPDGCTLWFASTPVAADDAGVNDGHTHMFQAARGH